tara:strand:- start:5986 stop:8961 length:2976 start_codon:yes stop_codon:yes gene_type:complete
MRFVFCLFLSFFSFSFSQDYDEALSCFYAQDYVCAKNYFSKVINTKALLNNKTIEYSNYYLFLSSLKLYNNDTEYLFNKFLSNYPLSEKKEDAIFYMSEYLFEKKQYKDVFQLLSALNIYKLDSSKKYFAFFYLGYSCYKTNKYDLAKSSFYELQQQNYHPHKEDALFYNAYILFLEGSDDSALEIFKELKSSKKYSKQVPYFISRILFDLGHYNELSDFLEPILDSTRCDYYNDLLLIQAKSAYKLKKYDSSIVYFEEYKQLKDTLTTTQLYQIGIAYYNKGLYGFAINHLNKILFTEDENIAQYAYYFLGDSYRKTQDYNEAMNAFRAASLIDSDSIVKHDASYQFAILCYEYKNPLYDPIQNLTEFINQYPKSMHLDEIYTCLANTYLNTSNYDDAISVLEKSELISQDVKKQYQKICFYKGVQLYNDGMYEQAIFYFNKSINTELYSDIFYKTYYWIGESYFNLELYDNALQSYQKLFSKSNILYSQSLYSQAYCYLKKKDYGESIRKFQAAIEYNKDQKILYDIYLRMADSYFASSDYQLSVNFFNKALKLSGIEDDYASYKKSTSYVLLNDYRSAIKSFSDLIQIFPESNYIDNALFDLGNTYILSKELDLSLQTFSLIRANFPNSLYYPIATLKTGLVYYMQGRDQEAISVLKSLLNQFPNTNTSQEALHVIKNIYNETGQADQFLDLIKNINHNYTDADLDSSTYSSSELQYMQGNYQNAINSFNSYLSYYPKGLFYLEANYYLYKSHEIVGDLESAMLALNSIVNENENKYTIDGIFNLAKMSYELQKYISSEQYFSQLLELASEIELKKQAILGLAESQFKLFKYEQLLETTSNLVGDGLFSGKEAIRIRYLKAFSLYKMNRSKQSLVEFKWLALNTQGALKAESYYYIALLFYNSNDYSDTQTTIFKLVNELPNYSVWVEKALLLLAKNYIAQEDMFQGQHILNELEKKSSNPEILNELNLILKNNFLDNKTDSLIYIND